jgi:ferredoxin-NADP reductase
MGDWTVRLTGKRERASGAKTFTLERPDGLDYRPGQFFFITIPSGAGAPPLQHHFSFSSSPTEPSVEFTTRLTGHPFKNRLDELEIGTPVDISGPDGDFILRPTMPRVCYVCAGIGITPARSMVRWAIDTGDPVDMVVLYGNRDLASTAFREEFEALASDRVRVVTVLSEPETGWTGRTGHVDASVVREEVPDWHDRYFFVSGPPSVVESLRTMLLRDVGVMEEDLVSEQFPGYQ